MAENPSNGHAPDGQQINSNGAPNGTPTPVLPRVAAPEGARSARAFDGSSIPFEEPPETTNFDEELNGAADEIDYRSDLRDSFAREMNGEPDAPLGISLDKEELKFNPETNGFEAFAPENFRENEASEIAEIDDDPDPYRNQDLALAGIDAVDTIEGEQLFADDGAGGEPPIDNTALAASSGGGSGKSNTPKDQELGLFEHLAELRSRLLYSIVGVMIVMCITWGQTLKLQDWFAKPIKDVLSSNGIKKGELVYLGAPDAFTFYFQFSLTSALIIAMPWVLFQVWRFVEPALTNSERRYTLILVPFSSVLFFLGAGLGYVCSPLFFNFFLQFNTPGVLAQWKYDDSVILMAKMLLIFGLAFQVPIVIIFGNKIGLLSRNLLIEYWRHAVVAIFIVVAVLTPTWDPVTMTACAVPPCLLYLLSIWIVKWL